MSEKLKPCPFCGGEAYENFDAGHASVVCEGCGATGPRFPTLLSETNAYEPARARARAAWNRRAGEESAKCCWSECYTCPDVERHGDVTWRIVTGEMVAAEMEPPERGFKAQLVGFQYADVIDCIGWPDAVAVDNGSDVSDPDYEQRSYYHVDREALAALADEIRSKSDDGTRNPDPMRPLATSLDLFSYCRRIREALGVEK